MPASQESHVLLVLGQGLADREARQRALAAFRQRVVRRLIARVGRDVGIAEQRRVVARRSGRRSAMLPWRQSSGLPFRQARLFIW